MKKKKRGYFEPKLAWKFPGNQVNKQLCHYSWNARYKTILAA